MWEWNALAAWQENRVFLTLSANVPVTFSFRPPKLCEKNMATPLFINNSVKSTSLVRIPDGLHSISGRFSRNVVRRPNGSNSLPSSKRRTGPGVGGGTVLSKPVLVPSRRQPPGAAQTSALPRPGSDERNTRAFQKAEVRTQTSTVRWPCRAVTPRCLAQRRKAVWCRPAGCSTASSHRDSVSSRVSIRSGILA